MYSKTPRVLAVIGPESGFIPNEIYFWKRFGFKKLNLSDRILRTETAFAFLLARLEEKQFSKKINHRKIIFSVRLELRIDWKPCHKPIYVYSEV